MPNAENVRRLGLTVTGGEDDGAVEDGTREKAGGEEVDSKDEADGRKDTVGKPFILSEGLPPVPRKLVARILRGEFVDMAELLRDNLEAQRRGSSSNPSSSGSSGGGNSRSWREVPDLLSWVQCFGTYIAIVTSDRPERMRQLLAYQTLIVREARRCGGRDWLAYDSYFRQQAVGDDKADWSRLNQSLYAVTFIAQGEREKGRCCILCLESDHAEEQCALYTPPLRHSTSRKQSYDKGSSESRESPASSSRSKGSSRQACFAWNQGDCRFPACKYRHVCVRCNGDHRIAQCPQLKGEKDGKAGRYPGSTQEESR